MPEFVEGQRVAYLARISKIGKDDNDKDREITERLAAQDNKVLEFIKEKGLILDPANHYEEIGSAWSRPISQRPVLQKILEDAQNKQFEVLCIYKVDRFDRNDEIRAMAFVRELLEAGVWVYSYEDNMWLNITTRMDRFILFYKLSMAGQESENISIRVKAKFAQKLKEAKGDKEKAKLGGVAPISMNAQQEANAKQWRAEGRSYHEIADKLGAPYTEYIVRMRLTGK